MPADYKMESSFVKPIRKTMRFNVNLVQHCNLNCISCDHFSPLAAPQFADPQIYEKDLARLAELFGDQLNRISLSGGETLLHPQLVEFISLSRRYFPEADLSLRSNGILLPRLGREFWETCRDKRAGIVITTYPVKIDRQYIDNMAADYGLRLSYTGGRRKTMNKPVIDPEAQGDVDYNFKKCHRGNGCLCLQEGRLYTCTLAPTARHLNEFFGQKLELSENDSIDFHRAGSAEDVLDFLRRPIPFCRYCDMRTRIKGITWRPSEKKIDEWFLTEDEKKKRDFWRKLRCFFGGK